jgi:hypothetical protein
MMAYWRFNLILKGKGKNVERNGKHIDVQYHFMRDMVENKKVLLE